MKGNEITTQKFSKIDDDEDLHETDKFEYLVQAIKPNTEAHRIVSSYPVTQENYALAVEALRDSFGQPDLLLQVFIRELLHLVITNVNSKAKHWYEDKKVSSAEETQETTAAEVRTRRGRVIQKPTRYGQWIHLII
ncbi:unnamed protein product [Orchesella dallaii]|uniref:Uncharacterized protein n=1 Tax=Orchesella dallaii TaxID=48710 RepID=A0ABP1RH42_9HEXA